MQRMTESVLSTFDAQCGHIDSLRLYHLQNIMLSLLTPGLFIKRTMLGRIKLLCLRRTVTFISLLQQTNSLQIMQFWKSMFSFYQKMFIVAVPRRLWPNETDQTE